jgi:hypothetical protein
LWWLCNNNYCASQKRRKDVESSSINKQSMSEESFII